MDTCFKRADTVIVFPDSTLVACLGYLLPLLRQIFHTIRFVRFNATSLTLLP